MKTYIKVLCLFVAVIMLLSVFGCGQTKPDDEGKEDDNPADITDPSDSEQEDENKLVITDTFYPQYTNAQKEYKEMKEKVSAWFYENLENGSLFSVRLGKDSFEKIKGEWSPEISKSTDADGNETVVATYVYGNTKFTLEGTLYNDFPTVDYVVWAESTDDKNTPQLNSFNAIDSTFPLSGSLPYTVHTSKGSLAEQDDFKLIEDSLTRGDGLKYNPDLQDGRSTSGGWPYFDVIGDNCGLMLAIGWSGIWQTSFTTTKSNEVNIKAYQLNLNSVILPGEKFRSPRVVLSYFDGDYNYGHNMFRKLIIEHYTPENDKENRFVVPLCVNFWGGTRESAMLEKMEKIFSVTDKIKYIWMDASWYGESKLEKDKTSNYNNGLWPKERGWWKINPNLFPDGNLKNISKLAQENGAEILLWIEIETLNSTMGSKATLGLDHYYNCNKGDSNPYALQLLKLSDETVLQDTIEWLTNFMNENGVRTIRLDFNQKPWGIWSFNDNEEAETLGLGEGQRSGATQNKYVVNLLRLWDAMYERFDNFVLDNCASGGRRLDIEMTKRGVSLWRTDFDDLDTSDDIRQCQNMWISEWLPLTAGGVIYYSDVYSSRSIMSCGGGFTNSISDEASLEKFKNEAEEISDILPYWYGSYYALTKPTIDNGSWQAFELYREDWQKGVVMVFRREESAVDMNKIKLKGLLADHDYIVHDYDDEAGANDFKISGEDLMEKGLNLGLATRSAKIYMLDLVLNEEDK